MAKFSAATYSKKLQEKVDKAVDNLSTDTEFQTEMSKIVSSAMYNVIKDNVYDTYSPKVYERRGNKGGLIDRNNIKVGFEGNTVWAKNIAEPNDSIIGTPIYSENKEGLLYEWMDKGRIGILPSIFGLNAAHWRLDRIGLTEKIHGRLRSNSAVEKVTKKAIIRLLK